VSSERPTASDPAVGSTRLLAEALDACREAWNAFDNGKRRHHRDALTGLCILGCQACAVEKLKRVLTANTERSHGDNPKA